MRRLDPCLAPAGYSPRRYETLSPAPVLGMGERLTDLRDMQALFANCELGGYWPADPQYAFEDSAGTTLASVNGVVGYRADAACGKHAIQATTANKPYLRRTPATGKYWYDSNTATGALTATFSGSLGSSCTISSVTPEGVSILENQTVGSTYNIAPPYGYNSDVLIINRALTAAEKALVTRVMQRDIPAYGSLVNAIPQMRGLSTNNEMQIDWSTKTSFMDYWRYGGNVLTSFPLIDTRNGTNFAAAWYYCSSLSSFPLIDTSNGTNFYFAWSGCSSLSSFPLIDTSNGTNFSYAWSGCSSLSSFPLIDTSKGTNFYSTWQDCSSLSSFPLIDTRNGINFAAAWVNCSSLSSFPLIDTSKGTDFNYAWYGCSSLSSFPAAFFDAWIGIPIANCFLSAWQNCASLTETSVMNIVVSLAASSQSAPATGKEITLWGAPDLATIQANSAVMNAVTTLKSRRWIPTYKGTAL